MMLSPEYKYIYIYIGRVGGREGRRGKIVILSTSTSTQIPNHNPKKFRVKTYFIFLFQRFTENC